MNEKRVFNLPLGIDQSRSVPALPAKPKKPRQPRRKTEPGGNSQQQVSKPAMSSPLRKLAAVYASDGWQTDFIKFPCPNRCRDWTDKAANCVIVWKAQQCHYWCVHEVEQMPEKVLQTIVSSEVA